MMKTTKNKIVVLIVFLLAHLSIYAQYSGGNSDGSSAEQLTITSCSTPTHFYAYFGGTNDGASVDILFNTTCGFSDQFYAYFGGTGDGGSVEELSQTSCGNPAQFYAYFGGVNDGAGTETLNNTVCGFPPQFYAYFGGDGDGYSLDKTAPICPTQPPVTDFNASATSVCVGQSVTFTDSSTNIPSAWTWTLPGGTPNSTIVQNPTVVYNTPGTYTVTLQAANFNGTDTKTVTNMITVTAYPTVTGTTPGSRCDTGTVTLGATASAGTLNWYANATGGATLGSGTSFTTPTIASTTTYYVETVNGGCSSVRSAVVATVNSTPTITSTVPGSRCGTGSVTLSATSSAGSTLWYANVTGGAVLATTNAYATSSITSNTTYYVEASSGGCTSARTAVLATVNAIPTITATTPGSRCDAGTITLGATASAGSLNWYNSPTGGTALGLGSSFTTPSLSSTTTYYVEAATANCTSVRTSVVATVNVTPSITGTTPNARCDAGTVTIGAVANAGALSWFAAATGGTAIGTGNSFTTPSIASTTTYYVEAANGSCVSVRTAVVATVNITPTVTSVIPGARCGTGIVTLSATASAGTLNWYNALTGGSFLGSGTSFATGTITTASTYYVEATTGSCTSGRTPVLATVNAVPSITSTTPDSRCDTGTLTLVATESAGNTIWYDVATGGTPLATTNTFVTPSISGTTTYYVEAADGTCTSIRTPVVATVNITAAPTGNVNQTFCIGETVGLLAVTGANITWYDAPTGGNLLIGGTLLVSGTTYYASQNIGSCESTARLAVNAILGPCLGRDDFEKDSLNYYPNPVADVLNISYTQAITKVEVVNMLGQLIHSKANNSNEVKVDMSRLASGTYLIRVTVDDKVETVKVIKQ